MNIIVSKDKTVRLTQYSSQSIYNLEEVNFYIFKEINEQVQVKLKKYLNTYIFDLTQVKETPNYKVYMLVLDKTGYSDVSLSARKYNLYLSLNNKDILIDDINLNAIEYTTTSLLSNELNTEIISEANPIIYPYGMTDDNEPIDIIDRDILISMNQNVLVAQDNVSQCIRFRMSRYYEGIDLYNKAIYIDYINKEDNKIYSIPIPLEYISIGEQVEGKNQEYMILNWPVPYSITKTPGVVTFAILAMDKQPDSGAGDEVEPNKKQYIWQTKTSFLTIQPNIGNRNIIETEDGKTIMEMVVDTISGFDIFAIDAENPTDGEVIIDSGTASDVMED